jgi:hypothetical protein
MALAAKEKIRARYVSGAVVLCMGRGGDLIEMFFEL